MGEIRPREPQPAGQAGWREPGQPVLRSPDA
jgi:hypothetical protein